MTTIMKYNKIILVVGVFLFSLGTVSAQNMYDAINVSRNEYYGTARSMGLGNAVTAVGGDLGMIGINPAGSAVANYGQFVVTPGLSISYVDARYYPEAGMNMVGNSTILKEPKMTLPNIGVSTVLATGRSRGVKSFSFAFVSNQTMQYNYNSNVIGINNQTSKIAEFAAAAAGWNESVLQDYNSFDNSNVSWDLLTAYQAGMYGSYGNGNNYVGVTEALDGWNHFVPSALSQRVRVSKVGSKNDMIANFGMNISDKVFVGINMGMPSASYSYSEIYTEAAVEPGLFPISFAATGGSSVTTYFNSGRFSYNYVSSYDGIYGKLGVIVLPTSNVRLGAAIQTPTLYTISESWMYSASTTFADASFDDSASSPEGSYQYNLMSPYIINLGAAITFAHRALVSVDYEMTDYSVMRFMDETSGFASSDPFYDLNEANKYFAGVSHELRLGAEFRVTPQVSIRVGSSVLTSPEKFWMNNRGEEVYSSNYIDDFDAYYSGAKYLDTFQYVSDKTTSFSAGFGYASSGSFFMDAAVKVTKYPVNNYYPYYDYDNYDSSGNLINALSPCVKNISSLITAAVTFGWRF